MQVAEPTLQHEVMIEAVENHNPEVIVIDEIGRELEAQAARTIAERGVQLIGTAHGQTLENLMLNPTLADLIGGIESVTLSDEEARRRGTQKTVLERRAPPTFDVLIELQNRHRLIVHEDVAAAVDAQLRGRPLPYESRYRDSKSEIVIESVTPQATGGQIDRTGLRMGGLPFDRSANGARRATNGSRRAERNAERSNDASNERSEKRGAPGVPAIVQRKGDRDGIPELPDTALTVERPHAFKPVRVYPFGVARNRLAQAARDLHVPLIIEDDPTQAQAILTLKNYYRRRPKLITEAERLGTQIYVLRANTITQMQDFVADLFQLSHTPDDEAVDDEDPFESAMHEAETAIQQIRAGAHVVDLMPQMAALRKVQHQMAREANLVSHSYGDEPQRHVRIFTDRRMRIDGDSL